MSVKSIHVCMAFLGAVLNGGLAGVFLATNLLPGSLAGVSVVQANDENPPVKGFCLEGGFASIVKPATPAVANISSSKIVGSRRIPRFPPFGGPFFEEFFGDRFGPSFNVPNERRQQSLGSGVLVSADGLVLTNDHVIHGAIDIKVLLSDKREFKARVLGSDPMTDIAVLKIEAKNHLPALPLGNSDSVQVGDFVLAIGNPFGVGQTVTMGIVGATGRGGLGIQDYEDFIQTDAAINPGNSGGALIDARGHLIGINTAIITRGGGNQGVGFAVPINLARNVMDQILKDGKVSRGWMGVTIQDLTPTLAGSFGMKETGGALVSNVAPESPASRAGISSGDIILSLNGEPIDDARSLRLRVAQMMPGTTVRLKIGRDNKEQEISLTLGELPSEAGTGKWEPESTSGRKGLSVETLTPEIASQLRIPRDTTGVVVREIQAGSAAAEAGLHRGDVIQEVNRKPVKNVAEFERSILQSGRGPLLLRVSRGGSAFFVAVEP